MHTLYLQAQDHPVAVERVLRVTRHRGFCLQSMEMQRNQNAKTMLLKLRVGSDKPIHLLQNQLQKLVEVQQVQLNEPEDRLVVGG